jgi:hypothetical protein
LSVVFMGLPVCASRYSFGCCVVMLGKPFVAEWHLLSTKLL